MSDSERINYRRYDAMAYRLNHEAYLQQIKGRNKPLTVFHPCAKALHFTSAMGRQSIPVSIVILQEAARTPCACHADMRESDLFNLFGDVIREIPTEAA